MNRTSPLEASLPSLAAIRETLPIVERDSPGDTVNARVTRSDIWENHFKSFHLEENVLALKRDASWHKFLLDVGSDNIGDEK